MLPADEIEMNEGEWVDVHVNGDGGLWSCSPSVLYQLPTDIFDCCMLLGRLNDKEDLDALVAQICSGEVKSNQSYGGSVTDIWVGVGGSWSGLPSLHFRIPLDVFEHLQQGDTAKSIGRLCTEDDLLRLIDQSRKEMRFGVAAPAEAVGLRSKPTNTERKLCGHTCTISSLTRGCCACEDLRPLLEEGTYPSYVDGQGWASTALRSAGYCPYCNDFEQS